MSENQHPVGNGTLKWLVQVAVSFLIVLWCFILLALVFATRIPLGHRDSPKMHAKGDLSIMFKLLFIYNMTYHTYPSMQPTNTMHVNGGGVRDLWPLYSSGIMDKDSLSCLRPPGCTLIPFSANPCPDEFDSKHIGYSYNSTVIPDDPSNPPLMAERGAADGILRKEEKPVFKDGVHVLMCNGQVKWLPVLRGGVLQVEGVTTTNELARLLE